MKTLLAAVDLSTGTDNILTEAAKLAKSMAAELLVVTVAEEVASEQAGSELQAHVERLQGDAVNCRSLVLEGTAADQILQAAQQQQAEMIIVGTHGHSAVFDILAGSATQDIVQRSDVPVLLVPTRR